MTSANDIIAAARREGRIALYEYEAKSLVREAGIIVPKSEVVAFGNDAGLQQAGERLGYPLALKAVSRDFVHKSEAGALLLDIKDAAGLKIAAHQIAQTVKARQPEARIQNLFLERMMPPGLELLIGGLRDEQFGPTVSFGLGGVWVEALRDVVFGVLPLSRADILAMINETRAGMFIQGYRGGTPLDQDALIAAVDAIGALLTGHDDIKEIEINPLRLYPKGAAALDARVILGRRDATS